MTKNKKDIFKELDNYEKDLKNSLTSGLVSVKNKKSEIEKYSKIAENSILKKKNINLRLTVKDFKKLKIKSLQEGIPYQTLITSAVHKYLADKL